MPNTSAKNMTASTSFSLMAVTMFVGMMLSSASMPAGDSPALSMIPCAPVPALASNSCATAGSTPSPGRIRFTRTSDSTTATELTKTV